MATGENAKITRALLLRIVVALVEREDDVKFEVRSSHQETTFIVCVASPDMGKLVGKDGRMAKALRTVLVAVGIKHGQRYLLFIQHAAATPVLTGSSNDG